MRKIIQIAAVHAPFDEEGAVPAADRLYALCDDGSVWYTQWSQQLRPHWVRLADIPSGSDAVED